MAGYPPATDEINWGRVREILNSAGGSYQLDLGKAETIVCRAQHARSTRPGPARRHGRQGLTLIVRNHTSGARPGQPR